MAEVDLLDIAEDVDRFQHASEGGQRLGKPISGSAPRQPFQDHIRWGRAMPQ